MGMNLDEVLREMRGHAWATCPQVSKWADAIEAAMTQPVAKVIQGWITPIGPWRLSEGAFVYAFPPSAQAELLSLTEQLAERDAEIGRLKADRDQGGKDYCALMDRHDEQHNEIEKLKGRLREAAQILIAEVGADGPTDAEEAARRAVKRIEWLERAALTRAEEERLRKAVKAGAKMIRWIAEHKDRMHAVAWLDALETAEMMEAALAGKEGKS